ncbi:amino acid ABC transporter permease [Microbacterium excoecariae]|uniref:amino acid ABC transporter permease n=1 Tax=Microbacterium excoecariae TaxID=2715210 RepID=UPI00197C1729|nr:amino acid ABC transporter permease [Microbacterium excoecariae]NHI16485.1 amino acid ABC transporter permease [Microbacterium excoecariae]
MSSVLYDVPGPKAVARNRVIGGVTVVVIAALIGWLLWRFVDTGQLTAEKWSVFTYTYLWTDLIIPAIGKTLGAFVTAAVGSIVLAFVLAIGRLSDHAWVRTPFTVITEVFRAIPVLILMMILYYGLPSVGVSVSPYLAVVVALIVYNGSVIAEALRAGVVALPGGQSEAGYAIGLRKTGVMTFILMPQAVRSMLPVILAQLVVALKDTALGSIITYEELLYVAKLIGGNLQTGRPYIPAAIVIGAIYIAMCLALSALVRLVEKRTAASPRTRGTAAEDPRAHDATVTSVIAAQQVAGDTQADPGGAAR